ncbi:hypothetical protein MCEMSEM18_01308 [Comamonadaceae bacterium]
MKFEGVCSQPCIQSLICDRCGREADQDGQDCEFQEFTSIQYRAGYGSVFGDGKRIEVDLCQHCVKDTLGTWLRTTDPLQGYNQEKHGGEFPNESERSFRARAKANIAKSIEKSDGVAADHVIAKLEKRLDHARSEMRQNQLIEKSSELSSPRIFRIGSTVITNKSIPSLDLVDGAHGSVVYLHETTNMVDVEFVMDTDGSTSVITVDAQCLSPWRSI